jgi:hypothetical protein
VIAGCGPVFTTATATSSSSGGGGQGGGASSNSSGGDGGGLPEKCTPGDLATCAPGSYCEESSRQCISCADISRGFTFDTTRKLNLDLPNNGNAPSFVRTGKSGQLLFTYHDDVSQDIGHADKDAKDLLKWRAGVREDYPVNTGSDESGPLYLPKAMLLSGLVKPEIPLDKDAVLFTSTVTGKRRVYAFVPGTSPPVPAEVDLKTSGVSNSSIAVAYEANSPRFWFGGNVSSDPNTEQLFTSLPGEVPVPLTVNLDNDCPLTTYGVAPWVTPDGRWLLFGAQRPNDGCAGTPPPQFHLFYVELSPVDGQPKAGASAKQILPKSSQNAVRPSLSEDRCVLFFSELDTSTTPFLWSSYAAIRK